ncbi:hypothetical protein POPTR_017G115566v4 [Populus trichocarpa]|uniref:Elongator complex protein 5 n=1 Tax=Populus trichocarpa TaxID=3694 RepID=A0A3N7G4Z7_POPTR|nr:elongator complex protein 5 isoform X2 [Populus trichocarpa]XP_024444339.1 elongator complex protein 5 isoform X2 [Populus trichocarpa]XP_024444341.1 elongator complex protein 5 isoform X2 [Populus trichocarpa]XP_024444342.1 elongator complex protein 5 isoform X2 [Populus trichocarpa]RQP02231.1 hypothetical protein POPTR_017G115566v4 [Populus trichocarpa]RQP02234.1 hypothetical protein POPTR_017G115566v4 [Populus trichocarpa]|eukprot:XP_024444338.1 elongator complex protein 5 isoform X1 [Populus trichocarpa]
MAESMCRTLRDGSLEGEQAPTLTIRDTTASPFGFHVFSHVLSQLSSFILASKSQSRCIVIVAFSRSPSFYVDLLKRRGIDAKSSHKCIQILDCYSDPLGWKDQLMMSGNFTDVSYEVSLSLSCVCRNVKDLDKLYSLILELGKGLVGQGKDCFSVAIDSLEQTCSHGWRAAMDPVWSCDAACSYVSAYGSLENLLIDIQIIVLIS